MVKSSRSSRSSRSSHSNRSNDTMISNKKYLSSENIWKFSFLLLILAIILRIVVVTMPGNIFINMGTDVGKAMNILSFIGVWIGIIVWIYRLYFGQRVLKYFLIGFILAVVIPFIILYIGVSNMVQQSPTQQLKNVLTYH